MTGAPRRRRQIGTRPTPTIATVTTQALRGSGNHVGAGLPAITEMPAVSREKIERAATATVAMSMASRRRSAAGSWPAARATAPHHLGGRARR